MGLFTNNKKLCPICGNPTPRLLATKVEDVPLARSVPPRSTCRTARWIR